MKKRIGQLISLLMALLFMFTLISCGKTNNDKNEDGEKMKIDVYLESIKLDDDRYSFEFDKEKAKYTVNLPAGRPTVPRVSATAGDGVEVKVVQAAIPDDQTSGKASIYATDGDGKKTEYTVEFVRDKANGFVLQYDDRFQFIPEAQGSYTFSSSDPNVVSVDENGVLTAKMVSNNPVTITAKGQGVDETLVVDRVEKAHINLFFMTGQSNGQGCYDSSNYGKDVANLVRYDEQLKLVEKIGQMGRVYSYDVHPVQMNGLVLTQKGKMYDMEQYAKQGHQAALGKTFYELSGEKVVFLQSAYSGAPIESWLDANRHEEAGRYSGTNFYQTTKAGYDKLIGILSTNYEIVYVANFWCQGETAMTGVYDKALEDYAFKGDDEYDSTRLMTDETYYNYFMMLHNDMKEDFNLQYNGIMTVKTRGASNSTTLVPIISAQFALANRNSDIYIATRKFAEIARTYNDYDKTSEGYGFMGTDNLHYNQIGYNYHGKEAATNAFYAIFSNIQDEKQSVEIIGSDGISRLTSRDSLDIKVGGQMRVAALCAPYYSNEIIEWTSDKEDVVTVNEFGVLTGVSAGSAVITATNENGEKQTIKVWVS